MAPADAMDTTYEPVRYRERTRTYYRALGYEKDYVWAHHDDVPFVRLTRPLSQVRLGLITTASPADFRGGLKEVWSGAVSPPPDALSTQYLAWDKDSTHTRDRGSYLPIEVVAELAAEGTIGGVAPRFHGVPTDYSQRKTTEHDAPQVLARLRDDGADAALLCPL
jgi:D-proline reductase (dithiol) PrdB